MQYRSFIEFAATVAYADGTIDKFVPAGNWGVGLKEGTSFLNLFVQAISEDILAEIKLMRTKVAGIHETAVIGDMYDTDPNNKYNTDWFWGVAYERGLEYQCQADLGFAKCLGIPGAPSFNCAAKGANGAKECTAKFLGATLMVLESAVDLFI